MKVGPVVRLELDVARILRDLLSSVEARGVASRDPAMAGAVKVFGDRVDEAVVREAAEAKAKEEAERWFPSLSSHPCRRCGVVGRMLWQPIASSDHDDIRVRCEACEEQWCMDGDDG